jgi:CheY-like chemotaxis protein
VLLDLMMPEMDGFEFLEGLRTGPGYEALDVVVMTAKELTEDDRRRLSGGVSRVLQKGGHSPEEFLAEVRARIATNGSTR